MSNRRANKRVRAIVRARMQETGETYQQALARLSPVERKTSVIEPGVATPLSLYQRAVAYQAIAFRCEDPEQRRRLEAEALSIFLSGRLFGTRGTPLAAVHALRAHAARLGRR